MKRSILQKINSSKKGISELLKKSTRNRKTVVVGCIRKTAKSFSVILICQKFMTRKHSVKLFYLFFLKNKILQAKLLL